MVSIRGRADVDRISQTPHSKRNWPQTSYALIERAAKTWPDRHALIFLPDPADIERHEALSFAQLAAAVRRAANLFASCGAQRNSVIAHALSNRPQTHFCRWGAEVANTGLGINPALPDDEIINLLVVSEALILVTEPDVWTRLMERIPEQCPKLAHVFLVGEGEAVGHPDLSVQQFDTALANQRGDRLSATPSKPSHDGSWFCTGGTTGPPKIARRTLAAETFNAMTSGLMLGDHLRPESVLLGGIPMFHVNACIATGLMAWAKGAQVLLAGPAGYADPNLIGNFWRLVERYRVSFCMASPYVYGRLLKQPIGGADISSMDFCVCGTALCPIALQQRFEAATGLRLLVGYGVTEASFTVTVNPTDGQRRDGSVGISLPWQNLRITELDADGEFLRECGAGELGWVLVSGDHIFEGYADTSQNHGIWVDCGDGQRWFNSGDLGHMDVDGYLWLMGRRQDLIIRDGRRIDPRSIEEPLSRHPMVMAAVAVGRPDAKARELPVAYVQLREGGQSDSEALMDFLRAEIDAPENMPVALRIVPALPLTPVGRIYRLSLVADEIRDVVSQVAESLAVPIDSVVVRANSAYGTVVTVEGAGNVQALKTALQPFAFHAVVHA